MFGALIGAGWADYHFTSNRHHYEDVVVLQRHSDTLFTLRPARMQPFDVTTCGPVDWDSLQMMKFVEYKQRYGCKDVSALGAYEFYMEHGQRKIYPQEFLDASLSAR